MIYCRAATNADLGKFLNLGHLYGLLLHFLFVAPFQMWWRMATECLGFLRRARRSIRGSVRHKGGFSTHEHMIFDAGFSFAFLTILHSLTQDACRPYEIQPCGHHQNKTHIPECHGDAETPKCRKKCQKGYKVPYKKDKVHGKVLLVRTHFTDLWWSFCQERLC